MLRLEAPEEHVRNKLTALGINCLGDWWCRGVFGPLEEFSFRGHLRDKNSTLMEALLFNWRKAPAAIFANLQVHPLSL